MSAAGASVAQAWPVPQQTAAADAERAALQRENEDLLQFVYLLPVAVARFGARGEVEMLNPKMVQLLQDLDIDSGRADGPAILDALCPGVAERWRAAEGEVGPVMPPHRSSLARPAGGVLHLLLQLVRIDAHCTLLSIEDVTTTVEQERELGRQRRRMAVALSQIRGYGVAMLDADGALIEWNPSIGRLLGIAEDQAQGRPLLGWVDAEAAEPAPGAVATSFDELRREIAREGVCQRQLPWRRPDGPPLWGDCVLTPLVEADGSTSGHVAVIRDVTEDVLRLRKLVGETLTDPLTGLYNRRGLETRLAADPGGRAGAGGPAWIMVDIDHFKRVNDTYGHDGGDAALRAVARALQSAARDGDTLARLGGEEFVLRLPSTTMEIAERVAERLRLCLEALVVRAGAHAMRLTASFGVALQAPQEAWSVTLQRADTALYQAKREGRNRVCVG